MPKVRFARDGDVGILTLADPPLNLFGREVIADLHDVLDEAATADIRALVVRAEGEVFTGGADVNMFVGLTGEQVERELDLIAIPRKLEALPFPTLAVVGGLYDADVLRDWGVVNRVVPDGDLEEKAMRFAGRLAAGPTRAHAATKRIVRAFIDGGVPGADGVMNQVAAEVVETEDFKNGVASFLEAGPGNATFAGR
jgi:enoyl-CoA hydratase/carnithine racemase